MSLPAPRRASYDDLLALPENVTGELLGSKHLTEFEEHGVRLRPITELSRRQLEGNEPELLVGGDASGFASTMNTLRVPLSPGIKAPRR
jgi:hypothetical protein